ncbi:conserved hypothetical protein [Shewanella halifaxensis HAW-EB4]|uniref:Uncharacterized protein n=1 Tax=Shewanella halifaxensis (strain HAW-EB4) TaxID=458817 RepID=B0TTB2_SHEHH|nr:hypothetical protein [Shewanella halifaxensis]ABZ78053.1 conserved hypothetical protein [Shewanella halifaxensis HAW-EB4]
MLDAICLFDESNPITYSIFKFQKLSDADIEKYRQALMCPACAGKAYYRKASKDGKAACFGSRYHQADCREFKPSAAKEREEQHAIEVNQLLVDSDAMMIDFSRQPRSLKSRAERETQTQKQAPIQKQAQTSPELLSVSSSSDRVAAHSSNVEKRIASEGLEKILHSLMRGSELAESELWVYTDEKYRWRAKNLFVNFADAEPTETGAPRMYWGTISHVDKELFWLNPADSKEVGIPIDKIVEPLKLRFGLDERRDFEGATMILFGKCFWNKAKNRKIIQLWGNDINRIFISKPEEEG